ncbi:MAG: lactate racemase domain-containing protein [Bacillota bacterium]
MKSPVVVPVRQDIPADRVDDLERTLVEGLERAGVWRRIRPGLRVAITSGSRGFSYNVTVLRTVVAELKSRGAEPFIFPAMGSHGGSTAEGQERVLRDLGITPESVGAPIRSCMEVVQLGTTASGMPVFCDRLAYEADAIVLFNRVKPHTAFRGPVESGLVKMAVVGMGKRHGAEAAHRAGLSSQVLLEGFQLVREKARLLCGIATVENFREEAAELQVLLPEEIPEREPLLLQKAWHYLPRLPFDQLDVLVVDRMGKDISGTGMDVNVIGIHRRIGGTGLPDIRTIVVLDLTPATHGNALGVGFADLVPRRLVDKIDFGVTYANVITTGFYGSGKVPVTLPTAREAVEVALRPFEPDAVRLVRIRDTKHLDTLWVSQALLPEVEANPHLHVVGDPQPLDIEE